MISPIDHGRISDIIYPIRSRGTDMAYQIYSLLIVDGDFSRWIEVSAVSIEAAKADVAAAYGDIKIVQWSVK